MTPETVGVETGAGGAAIVMVEDEDFALRLTDVAVRVTVAGLGTVVGAVYVIVVPEALDVAESEPHPFETAHETVHVTPFAAESFMTTAVNVCC